MFYKIKIPNIGYFLCGRNRLNLYMFNSVYKSTPK